MFREEILLILIRIFWASRKLATFYFRCNNWWVINLKNIYKLIWKIFYSYLCYQTIYASFVYQFKCKLYYWMRLIEVIVERIEIKSNSISWLANILDKLVNWTWSCLYIIYFCRFYVKREANNEKWETINTGSNWNDPSDQLQKSSWQKHILVLPDALHPLSCLVPAHPLITSENIEISRADSLI